MSRDQRKMTWLAAILGLIAISIFVVPMLVRYWTSYRELSPDSYQLAAAALQATNLKNAMQIEKIEALSQTFLEEGKIDSQEHHWIHQICNLAKDGKWEAAGNQARRMMSDQIKKR